MSINRGSADAMGILTSPGGRAAGASAQAGSVPVGIDGYGLRKEHRICPDCVRELFDPRGRRHLYPLVRCRECGPPAAEPRVRPLALCEDCRRECDRPGSRRGPDDAAGCAACGPALRWNGLLGQDALAKAVAVIEAGGVVALRDGFADQIVCDAVAEPALARMDGAPGPVRVLVRHVSAAREVANLSFLDIRALAERSHPATLVRLREPRLPRAVRRATPDVDLFLPRTPLQHLLTSRFEGPLAVWDRYGEGELPYDGTLTVGLDLGLELGVGHGLDQGTSLPARPASTALPASSPAWPVWTSPRQDGRPDPSPAPVSPVAQVS
ncbi:Sua5/YciO/YrdC/YwlC family protein [Microbispora triticiradicis]|uniref:Sua5/YciO/YrdC/YwlC family protein n=1 Tax=Microbispora triticiradicis TaxID=2200763 RepID=UPI001AD6D46C|nr:Sua5/YciO/YrdC/YwlC family protein [Microbispora triticiradicis]MBO4270451.1 hypothetical protein [Microbispora triticiradicis]